MIPIGAPVIATGVSGLTVTGKIEYYHKDMYPSLAGCAEVIEDISGWGILCPVNGIKIRYDNPAPFTLWQRKALKDKDDNDFYESHRHFMRQSS